MRLLGLYCIYFLINSPVNTMATCLKKNMHSNINKNAKSSIHNNTNTSNIKFTAVDFQHWNQTTSVVHTLMRLGKTSKILQLRKELINAIGECKIAVVQAFSLIKYRIEFKYSSDQHAVEINDIAFRSVHLTALSAYKEVKSVFVEKAPHQMQDNILFETLVPYGGVISVQHLKIKDFPPVRLGTRRVSMVVTKAIPSTNNTRGFPVTFNYRGQPIQCFVCQEVGHASKDCPRSRQERKKAGKQQQSALPKVTEKRNGKKSSGHADLTIQLDGPVRTTQTTKTKSKSPLED